MALVLTPDIPSLRLLHAACRSCPNPDRRRSGDLRRQRHLPEADDRAEQIEEHLGFKVGHQVPYDGENFLKAVNEGQPYIVQSRRTPPLLRSGGWPRRCPTELPRRTSPSSSKRGILRGFLNRTLAVRTRPRPTGPSTGRAARGRRRGRGGLLVLAQPVDEGAHRLAAVVRFANVAKAIRVADLVGHQRLHHQLAAAAAERQCPRGVGVESDVGLDDLIADPPDARVAAEAAVELAETDDVVAVPRRCTRRLR